MSDLTLYFAFESQPGLDSSMLAKEVSNGLQTVDSLDTSEVSTAKARVTGLEIVAAITLATQVVRNARQIAEDLRAIATDIEAVFDTVRKMARELKAKDVTIPIDGERKSLLGSWKQEDYLALAREVAESTASATGAQETASSTTS
jgi:hypothetical protein